MLQNPCKTLGYKKNMVCEIPPGGGGKPYPASGLYPLGLDFSWFVLFHLDYFNTTMVKLGNFGHQVNSDSDLVCFIS